MANEDLAGEILDDLGVVKFNDLYIQTKFGSSVHEANQLQKRQREAAISYAVQLVVDRVEALRPGLSDDDQLALLDKVTTSVKALEPKSEGSENPQAAMASSS